MKQEQVLREFLRDIWWRGERSVDEVIAICKTESVTLKTLQATDQLLSGLPETEALPSFDEVAQALNGIAPRRVTHVARFLEAMFERHPVLALLHQLVVVLQRQEPRSYPRRKRVFSVQPEALPPEIQDTLQAMRAGHLGAEFTCPVPTMITSIETKACEITKLAQEAGIHDALSIEALKLYERSLVHRVRKLSLVTIESSIKRLYVLIRYIGGREEEVAYLQARMRHRENQSQFVVPQKLAKVEALPQHGDLFQMAFERLEAAAQEQDPRKAYYHRNTAAALAIFAVLPLRVADSALVFGETLLWDEFEGCYRISLRTSKTDDFYETALLPELGSFVDALVLHGCGPEHLEDLRTVCVTTKRPLFIKHMGEAPHAGYVSRLWREAVGTGSHAARTHLHDLLGSLGQEGVEMALAACAQRSQKTAEVYRTRAFQKNILAKIHGNILRSIVSGVCAPLISGLHKGAHGPRV